MYVIDGNNLAIKKFMIKIILISIILMKKMYFFVNLMIKSFI